MDSASCCPRRTQFGLGPSEDSMEASAIFTQELAPGLTAPSGTSLAKDAGGEKKEWPWSDFPGDGRWQSDVESHFRPSSWEPPGLSGAQITTTNLDSNIG